MINSETFIVKRDGKKEAFSLDKIKNAISKAFLSVGSFATQDVITNILSRVNISDGTSVEDIQNQVEIALMAEHYYSVAKAFMLYRQKHLEDRAYRSATVWSATKVVIYCRKSKCFPLYLCIYKTFTNFAPMQYGDSTLAP